MPAATTELFLARHAEAAWSEVIRPWLLANRGRLERSYLLVPTRGQAFGLKQRCLQEKIALLGVEFVTPGLARKKWHALAAIEIPALEGRPAMGRELLLAGLRLIIDQRVARLVSSDPHWGFWKSLQSDPERALEDFDDLLRAGFSSEHFPLVQLREAFGELSAWVKNLGYDFVSRQNELAALTPVASDENRISGRLLAYGFSAEAWNEFFNIAALARRFAQVTVVLPEPEFRGKKTLDENWIELWQSLLGCIAVPLDESESAAVCGGVADLWEVSGVRATQSQGDPTATIAEKTKVLVGFTREDEVHLVAEEIARLLATGAEQVGVIFPRACPAHLRLGELLAARDIPFADIIGDVGQVSIDLQIEQALLAFYEHGARLEELLDLWGLLHAAGQVARSLADARDVCERLFDEGQTHSLGGYITQLENSDRAEWREVLRVARILLPAWPAELSLAEALGRFAAVRTAFDLVAPAGWSALEAFAARETRVLSARVVCAVIGSFLPESVAAPGATKNVFARVILGTRRRVEGVAWSHLILMHANAGVWPERRESSPWLTDEQRKQLNESSRFSLGLFTSEDRTWLEKRGLAGLARDTREQVIFSAAVFDDEEQESRRMPNAWLERLIWFREGARPAGQSFEEIWEGLARGVVLPAFARPDARPWFALWQSRRDPLRPFDEFFFSVNPEIISPKRLPARLIERAVVDPAELWFNSVLGASQVAWTPLVRTRRKALGQLAHRVLANALREPSVEGRWRKLPSAELAREKLKAELSSLRAKWPSDRYWDSFRAELARVCGVLLENIYSLFSAGFVGVEMEVPAGATVPLDVEGTRLPVYGRIDLVFSDRPGWENATVDIIDFKTGIDAKLSAERMARDGSSLQLGVYLGAAQSLGISSGRVWMIKPLPGDATALDLAELPLALMQLGQIKRHIESGRYGALTREKSDYTMDGFSWPLACPVVPHSILEQKFMVTFGDLPVEVSDE